MRIVAFVAFVAFVGVLILALMALERRKEGFVASEDAITPDEFSFALLQSVMGPIRRLSSRLLDMGAWKERIALSRMTPSELARWNLSK